MYLVTYYFDMCKQKTQFIRTESIWPTDNTLSTFQDKERDIMFTLY